MRCRNFFRILIFICFSITIISCDDRSINPFEDDTAIVSVQAAIDINSTFNSMRVRDVNQPLQFDVSEDNTLDVQLFNLTKDTPVEIEERIIEISETKLLNYFIRERFDFDSEYLLTITKDDGKVSESLLETPLETEIEISKAEELACNEKTTISFGNVRYPEFIRLEVGLFRGGWNWDAIGFVNQFERIEDEDKVTLNVSPDNLALEVFTPERYDPRINNPDITRPTFPCVALRNKTIRLRFTHFDKGWNGISPFINLPDQAARSRNVDRGIGTFASFYTDEFTITIK